MMIRFTHHQQMEYGKWNMAKTVSIPIAKCQMLSSKRLKGAF